jgi:hypothetical protein
MPDIILARQRTSSDNITYPTKEVYHTVGRLAYILYSRETYERDFSVTLRYSTYT